MARPESKLDAVVNQALDLFGAVKSLRVRRMFGGAGVYAGAAMFALVTPEGIFLKADDETKADFEAAESSPFTYTPPTGRRPVTMSYWRLPDALLDDQDEACVWARKAIEAAKRKSLPAPRRGPRA